MGDEPGIPMRMSIDADERRSGAGEEPGDQAEARTEIVPAPRQSFIERSEAAGSESGTEGGDIQGAGFRPRICRHGGGVKLPVAGTAAVHFNRLVFRDHLYRDGLVRNDQRLTDDYVSESFPARVSAAERSRHHFQKTRHGKYRGALHAMVGDPRMGLKADRRLPQNGPNPACDLDTFAQKRVV